jgi:hypothetical protein
MLTVPYTRLYVQWTGCPLALACGLAVSSAITALLLFSGLEHALALALTMLPAHMLAIPITPHLHSAWGSLTAGTCGGGAVTHC